jgi:hypothetical protein
MQFQGRVLVYMYYCSGLFLNAEIRTEKVLDADSPGKLISG